MLNTCHEQIGCARPIDPRGGIQLAGKSTADSARLAVIAAKGSEIYKCNLTLEKEREREKQHGQ